MAATDTIAAEHRVLTEACGLLDRSERGKLALSGGEAKVFLNGQVTNDVEALAPDTGCYAAVLTPKGKMLGDVRILDTSEELLLDLERTALQGVFNVLRTALIGFDAELHKRTLQRGLLSLLGPRARNVADAGDLPRDEHANRPGRIGEAEVLLVATDVGVDVDCAAEDTTAVAAALCAGGAVAVSEAAAECLRVERGRPRYGVDMDETTIPQEAGLNGRAVSFTKGCYVGQETVARLHWRGKPNRYLRGLRLSSPARSGDPLHLGERQVGTIGSVALSPEAGPIALSLVRREAAPGAVLIVGDDGINAEVVELPFSRS